MQSNAGRSAAQGAAPPVTSNTIAEVGTEQFDNSDHVVNETPPAPSGLKRAHCQFDCADADDADEADLDGEASHDDAFFDCLEEPETVDQGEHDEVGTEVVRTVTGFVEAKKRRVQGKTAAADTIGLPLNPQITKQEQRGLKGIEKERKRKLDIEDNRARAKARRAVLDDPSLTHGTEIAVADVEDDEIYIHAPHFSHGLREMRTHAITYCNTCSHWMWHNKHSKLVKRCEPLLRGNATALKLLQCDIVPGSGVEIPAEFQARRGPHRKK